MAIFTHRNAAMEADMNDAQLTAAIFAAPFLTLSLVFLIAETLRIRTAIRAEKQPRRRQRPF